MWRSANRLKAKLILTEILQEDHERPFLTEAEVRHYMGQGPAYLMAEQDMRGYIVGKGWAHALAPAADFFMTLAPRHLLYEGTARHPEVLCEATGSRQEDSRSRSGSRSGGRFCKCCHSAATPRSDLTALLIDIFNGRAYFGAILIAPSNRF